MAEKADVYEKNDGKEEKQDPSEIPADLQCGYLGWRPRWMQRFNNPRVLLACVSCSMFVQGWVVSGLTSTNMSTLERRFNFRSGLAALIPGAYDLAAGLFAVIFGYLAMFLHNGKILGVCTTVMGFGSLTMLLPHFLAGPYELGPRPTELCDISDNSTDFCDSYKTGGSNYLPIFMIGQFLHGVGGASIYTVAAPYMDNNIKRKNTALYLGIMYSFAALGPAVGFICGGLFLSLYVDIGRIDLDDIEIDPKDPRWVGAWWMGYIVSGILCFCTAFFYFGFPRRLSTADKYAAGRVSEAYKGKGDENVQNENFGRSSKDVATSLKVIFTNPVWICLTLSAIEESSGVVAFTVFLPKVMQFQYSQTMVMAAIWGGLVVIPGAAGGMLLGGLIPRWFNLKVKGLLALCLFCITMSFFLCLEFLLRCPMPKMAGLSVPYFNSSIDLDIADQNVIHPCNGDCNCTVASYDPICGQDGVEYFTPCHGGCVNSFDYVSGKMAYSNCSCIAPPEPGYELPYAQAIDGICADSCDVFPIFLALFFFINIFTFMTSVAGSAATLRVVPEKEKSFAFGVQSTLIRYLGNIPGPIILGNVFDDSCWIWQNTCGEEGACWVYSSDVLAQRITILGLAIKGFSMVMMFLAFMLYKPPAAEVVAEKDILPDTEFGEEKEKTGESFTNGNISSNQITHQENGVANVGFQGEMFSVHL